MYCIRCGVEMSEGEKQCPLCKTAVFHPDFINKSREDDMYPSVKLPERERRSKIWQVMLTAAFILPLMIVALCDFQFNREVTWSGYVMGALVVGYIVFALPLWFKRPNLVIFVPCGFAAGGLFVFYISIKTDGGWFLTFGLPIVCAVGILVTAVVTLMKYVYGGRFFIFGGAFIALGAFMLLCEHLTTVTFEGVRFIGWSLYPLVTFVLLGGLLIFLGICRPARESMERKFFI